MKRNTIYLVDENAPARRANAQALRILLDNQQIHVLEQEPLPNLGDYTHLIAASSTAAFVLDQKMKQAGKVHYNGTDLAAHLRGIDSKMPIYILTGYAEEKDAFEENEYLVEYIIAKKDITDQNSKEAKIVKARMLRHLNVFNDVLEEREQRFHHLLVKSFREKLTSEEESEIGILEIDRSLPQQAKEIGDIKALEAAINELRRRISPEEPPL